MTTTIKVTARCDVESHVRVNLRDASNPSHKGDVVYLPNGEEKEFMIHDCFVIEIRETPKPITINETNRKGWENAKTS